MTWRQANRSDSPCARSSSASVAALPASSPTEAAITASCLCRCPMEDLARCDEDSPGDTGQMSAGEAAQPGDVPLTGGRMTSGIGRRRDMLLRPMGAWSAAVHEYLRHLEAAGFRGSPRVLGTDGDREVLTFLPGDVANDPSWQPGRGHRLPPYARTDMALRAAAILLRE